VSSVSCGSSISFSSLLAACLTRMDVPSRSRSEKSTPRQSQWGKNTGHEIRSKKTFLRRCLSLSSFPSFLRRKKAVLFSHQRPSFHDALQKSRAYSCFDELPRVDAVSSGVRWGVRRGLSKKKKKKRHSPQHQNNGSISKREFADWGAWQIKE